jgi:hypothetical protein
VAHVDGPRGLHAGADEEAERAERLHCQPLHGMRQEAVLARLVPHPRRHGDGGEQVEYPREYHHRALRGVVSHDAHAEAARAATDEQPREQPCGGALSGTEGVHGVER